MALMDDAMVDWSARGGKTGGDFRFHPPNCNAAVGALDSVFGARRLNGKEEKWSGGRKRGEGQWKGEGKS